ncbi:MAG: hypothetical protein PHN39_00895 [Candidatus Pacebacteria bacterium]|nr:hypothetical protein [Candidatus Paceibacterota bacterium]
MAILVWLVCFLVVFLDEYHHNKGMVPMRISGLWGHWPWADWSMIAINASLLWSMTVGTFLPFWVAISRVRMAWGILAYSIISTIFILSGIRISDIHPNCHGVLIMIGMTLLMLIATTYVVKGAILLIKKIKKVREKENA